MMKGFAVRVIRKYPQLANFDINTSVIINTGISIGSQTNENMGRGNLNSCYPVRPFFALYP
jgi:hypothetical protein